MSTENTPSNKSSMRASKERCHFIKMKLTERILMRSIADEMGSRLFFDGVHEVRFAAGGGHVIKSMV